MFYECEYEMLYESSNNHGIYSPRKPRTNYYYRCVEENFEVLERECGMIATKIHMVIGAPIF